EPSVYGSFFRLGGDSILALQAVGRARAAGLLITPAQVFELQTIAALAEAAVPLAPAAADGGAPPPGLPARLPPWLAVPAPPALRLPRADGREGTAVETDVIALDTPSEPLAEAAAAYGMTLGELALAAFAQALQPESGDGAPRFELGMRRP